MAQLLFQEPDDCAGPLSRARSVHPADEAEEHSASPARGRADHSPGAGVLRLSVLCWLGRNCVPFGEPLGRLHSGAEAPGLIGFRTARLKACPFKAQCPRGLQNLRNWKRETVSPG